MNELIRDDCQSCWHGVAGHIDKIEGGHLYTEPYEVTNFADFYLAYTIPWHEHETTFLINDCGYSCANYTQEKTSGGGLHIWGFSNTGNMGLICSIKAKNQRSRSREGEYQFGRDSPHIAVAKLESAQTFRQLQMEFK